MTDHNNANAIEKMLNDPTIDGLLDRSGLSLRNEQSIVHPIYPASYQEYQTQLRAYQDWQHQQRNEAIGRFCLGIGVAVVGAIGLLLALAIFAAATRPVVPPPPRINDRCIAFCGGGNG